MLSVDIITPPQKWTKFYLFLGGPKTFISAVPMHFLTFFWGRKRGEGYIYIYIRRPYIYIYIYIYLSIYLSIYHTKNHHLQDVYACKNLFHKNTNMCKDFPKLYKGRGNHIDRLKGRRSGNLSRLA